MRTGSGYRFSLQFGADTESKIRIGELLEKLGNKKSALIVPALIESIWRNILNWKPNRFESKSKKRASCAENNLRT